MNEIDDIKKTLNLEPHPTCGFAAVTHVSDHQIPADALPPGHDGPRAMAAVLYFLITADVELRMHRIRCDQMYHHYQGAPLQVLMLFPDGSSVIETVGTDMAAGMRPQLLVPAQTWHISRLQSGGEFALLATTAWPAELPQDMEFGDIDQLAEQYPDRRDDISAFTSSG